MKVMPKDFGVHHRISSSGVVQAWKTRRAGASKMRVTTTSRSERRSVLVSAPCTCSLLSVALIVLFLLLELFDDVVEFVEAGGPEAAMLFQPGGLFVEAATAETAGPDAPDFLGHHEARLFEDADVFLHAGEGHVEFVGELGDRGVGAPELLEDAAACRIRQGGEGGIDARLKLNHVVQYCITVRNARATGRNSGGRSSVLPGRRNAMIRKLKSGEYRLYSKKTDPKTGKRRNLGTFDSREAAEKHERDVQYFKRH